MQNLLELSSVFELDSVECPAEAPRRLAAARRIVRRHAPHFGGATLARGANLLLYPDSCAGSVLVACPRRAHRVCFPFQTE